MSAMKFSCSCIYVWISNGETQQKIQPYCHFLNRVYHLIWTKTTTITKHFVKTAGYWAILKYMQITVPMETKRTQRVDLDEMRGCKFAVMRIFKNLGCSVITLWLLRDSSVIALRHNHPLPKAALWRSIYLWKVPSSIHEWWRTFIPAPTSQRRSGWHHALLKSFRFSSKHLDVV